MTCSPRQSILTQPFQIAQRLFDQGPNSAAVGAVTVTENDGETRFEFDVPGFPIEDINIDLRDGHLVVAAERTVEESDQKVYTERTSSKFRRVIRLGDRLDPTSGDAELKDGVLTLTFARKQEATPQRIEIRSGGNAGQQP